MFSLHSAYDSSAHLHLRVPGIFVWRLNPAYSTFFPAKKTWVHGDTAQNDNDLPEIASRFVAHHVAVNSRTHAHTHTWCFLRLSPTMPCICLINWGKFERAPHYWVLWQPMVSSSLVGSAVLPYISIFGSQMADASEQRQLEYSPWTASLLYDENIHILRLCSRWRFAVAFTQGPITFWLLNHSLLICGVGGCTIVSNVDSLGCSYTRSHTSKIRHTRQASQCRV